MACAKEYDDTFNNQFVAILKQDQKAVKVNTIFKQAIGLLLECKHAYKMTGVHCKFFFVHPKNRGGLLISWHNAHRNGANIFDVGADKSVLMNAYALEMSNDPKEKARQVAVNESVIKRSKGLLAQPTSYERYITIGCGHTVAFCRAAAAGCSTSQKTIQDDMGKTDLQKICGDAEFSSMIHEGWDWTIVPAWVDRDFPMFANIGQKALNASNHVASLVGELETAKSIADVMDDGAEKGWEEAALDSVRSTGAPSASYAGVILDFVQQFSGGPGSPLISFMDTVAKEFQCNAVLGETFWKAVTSAIFSAKHKKYPLIRVGLLLTNLTSPKNEDGVAKMIVKADVGKLTQKGAVDKVNEVEDAFAQAFDVFHALQSAGKIKEADVGALGRFMVRCILRLTGKEKDGREGKHTMLYRSSVCT